MLKGIHSPFTHCPLGSAANLTSEHTIRYLRVSRGPAFGELDIVKNWDAVKWDVNVLCPLVEGRYRTPKSIYTSDKVSQLILKVNGSVVASKFIECRRLDRIEGHLDGLGGYAWRLGNCWNMQLSLMFASIPVNEHTL